GGQGQVVFEEERNLVAENASKHQDRCCDSLLAQQNPLLQHSHAQIIHTECAYMPGDLHQAVPVSVGLEDGHNTRRSNLLLDSAIIFCQTVEVNLDQGGANHTVGGDCRLVD